MQKLVQYIGAGRNLRDILLAVIFLFMQQGKALDFKVTYRMGNAWKAKELVITINAYLMQS